MADDAIYILLNCIIRHIPVWTIRRWLYLLLGMKIGHGSRIGIGTVVVAPSRIEIGDRTIINEWCHLDGRGSLRIGSDCSISIYSAIISASHSKSSESFEYHEGPVEFGDRVWIGARAVILDGSSIGDEVVISAGSVVKGGCAPSGVYSGIPAKRLAERNLRGKYQLHYKPFFR